MKRKFTGIFGGSFNPPHIGHIILIDDLLRLLPFDRIFFVPTKIPPHKNVSDLIDEKHRLIMLKLSIKEMAGAGISTFEIDRDRISFSFFTIEHFLEHYGVKPCNLFFILGVDAFYLIKTWKNYPDILNYCNFLILKRSHNSDSNDMFSRLQKGFPIRHIRKFDHAETSTGIYYFDNILLDISSTEIRERIKAGLSVKYLVASDVYHYIAENKLYKEHN